MNTENEFFVQPPPPATLLFAIRSIGYSFEMAVADIIDNSISAFAKEIKFYSNPSDSPYVCFLDDGAGMNNQELKNAMLLGSNREQKAISPLELGRYGLGLKSASLSQCRKFTVISKKDNTISAMSFDIGLIKRENKWLIHNLPESKYIKIPCYEKLQCMKTGTLVVWEDFDRIKNSSKSFDETFRKLVKLAKSHVEFVFHRFYDKVNIYFNELRIEKRDPFLLESYGRQQQGRPLSVTLDGHDILIFPYTLPYSNSLSNEERKLLGNPHSIYDEQGLYLYRNERLIAWGSWFHTDVRSELNKLARVQVDIPSALDDFWMLDVKKSTAKIPDKIREQIRIAVNDSTYRSQGTLRHPGKKEVGAQNKVWMRYVSPDSITISYKLNRENPLYQQLKNRLCSIDLSLLEKFISQAENYIPKTTIYHDECQDLKILNSDETSTQDKEEELIALVKSLSRDSSSQEDLLRGFLKSQAYEMLAKNINNLLRRVHNE